MKGHSVVKAGSKLTQASFLRTKDNGINETWRHLNGSEVRIHKYENKCPCAYESGNNAHIHIEDLGGNQLNDHGFTSPDPNQPHFGICNPADLPIVRGRPHGS